MQFAIKIAQKLMRNFGWSDTGVNLVWHAAEQPKYPTFIFCLCSLQ